MLYILFMKLKFPLKFLDCLIILIFAASIVFSFAVIKKSSESKLVLVITAPGAEYVYPLDKDSVYEVKGKLGVSTVCVKEGKAFFKESPCPNKTCMQEAPAAKAGQWSACLPNEVFIRIEAAEESENEEELASNIIKKIKHFNMASEIKVGDKNRFKPYWEKSGEPITNSKGQDGKPTIVFHAVSVGEVNAVETLVKKARTEFADYNIILTTVTKTGHEVAIKKLTNFVDEIVYFPYDFCFSVSDTDSLCRASLYAVHAADALAFIHSYRMKNIVIHNNNSYILNVRVIVVPTSISVSIFISSEYFLIFGRPMPAPKPSALTFSGAVE